MIIKTYQRVILANNTHNVHRRSLCWCDTCNIWQLLHSKPALPRFGRQGSRLIFYRVAFHKLINLCFSLLSEVPAPYIRALSGETAGIPNAISTRTEKMPKIDQRWSKRPHISSCFTMFSHASTISQLSAKDGTSFAPPGHTPRPPLPCSAQAQALRPSICLPAWPVKCGTGAAMRHCATSDMWACNDFVFVPSHPGWCSSVADAPCSLWLWWINNMSNVYPKEKTCINHSKYGKPKQEQTNTHVWTSKNYFTSKTITPKGQVKHTTMYSI